MIFAKHWAATLDDYVIDLAWSPDGALLAAAAQSGAVTLYDATTGAVRHRLAGHADGTDALAWLPALQRTEDRDQKTDPTNTNPSSALRPLSSGILATGGQDGCVRFWDAATGAPTAEARLGSAWVEHLAWASATDEERPSKDHPPCLFAAAGRKLFALHADGSVAHTFPDAPKTLSALAASPSSLPAVALAKEGVLSPPSSVLRPLSSAIAAACFGQVALWDATTFAPRPALPYGNTIHALTWSPDGRWLVAGCQDNAVHLWAPAEALELHMSGYETRLKELSFSSDARWLATGGGRDACVWDCAGAGPEGREPLLLPHSARVCATAFQHRHDLLATADVGGGFTLWAPNRKQPLIAEARLPAPATRLAWRADDALLAVGTAQGHVFTFRTGA